MKKILALLSITLLIISCKKENDNIVWNKSYGPGNAYFAMASADSGIIVCGVKNNKPYLLKLSSDKNLEADYISDQNGIFTSAWGDTSCFIACGSSDGKLLISRISTDGNKNWDTTLAAGFPVEVAGLAHTDGGSFLAIGSANPDSSDIGSTGLLFVRFDTSGTLLLKKEITDPYFISANNFTLDISGNIYLALTRRNPFAKSRASVSKYNSDIQKLWETELYNNPDVTSTCMGVQIGLSDSVYVTGKTEVARTGGTLDNSYIASLGKSGTVGRKKYLENSNAGCDLVFDSNGRILMLNRNCFFISIIDPLTGYGSERLRMFSECDAYKTDAFGSAIDIFYNGSIIVAGSLSGNFYLALKAEQ
jgi:hypothetical protein